MTHHAESDLRDRHSRRQVLGYFGIAGAATIAGLAGLTAGRGAPSTAASAVAPGATITESPLIEPSPSPRAVQAAIGTPSTIASAATATPQLTPTMGIADSSIASATPMKPSATPTAATPTPSATANAPRVADVVGHAEASYVGAVPARAANVELAARRIDGAILAPGEIFSFLDHLGPQTLAAGFQIGYGIILVNSQPQTAPMIGGGICDVSTILFQAAFRAGLGIVEHHSHSIWIEHYGAPPDGAIGLDATVDVQPVDFKFQNTTGDVLKISCACQDQLVTVTLLGANPDWVVTLGQPVVVNRVKTDPTVVRQPDSTLPVGTEVWIETARDGFDVTWERQVMKGDRLVDHYKFTNHYLPSRNIQAVGAKGATPTPSPTTTPSPILTPTVTPSPTAKARESAVASPSTTTTAGLVALGPVRVPGLIGLTEDQAKTLITQAGLSNTYTNYQSAGDVSPEVLKHFGVGAVLSQIPAPGSIVPLGSTVYLAVYKS